MATDYDDLRPEVKEAQEQSLEALQTASAPTAMTAVLEVEESDEPDSSTPAGEFIAEEPGSRRRSASGGRIHVFLLLPGSPPVADRTRKGRTVLLHGM